jgi:tRNA pseudouridine55 synthase
MIVNINKPVGWSSFDVVKKIRGITGEKKVGHGGSLDPFAEGVLILGTGKDTKELAEITSSDKSYIFTLNLGITTNTLDTEGEIIKKKNIPDLNETEILNNVNSFLGEGLQTPPMFSAKKVNGKKLYELARKDIIIERKPIKIDIKEFSLISYNFPNLILSVTVSKGTYIRVLGKDLAEKLGTVGYLTKLVRTRVSKYLLSDSITIDAFEKKWKL